MTILQEYPLSRHYTLRVVTGYRFCTMIASYKRLNPSHAETLTRGESSELDLVTDTANYSEILHTIGAFHDLRLVALWWKPYIVRCYDVYSCWRLCIVEVQSTFRVEVQSTVPVLIYRVEVQIAEEVPTISQKRIYYTVELWLSFLFSSFWINRLSPRAQQNHSKRAGKQLDTALGKIPVHMHIQICGNKICTARTRGEDLKLHEVHDVYDDTSSSTHHGAVQSNLR